MNAIKCITGRTMCRSFASKRVEEQKITAILEAGRRAPSAKNRQPWIFVVVRSRKLREKMLTVVEQGRLLETANPTSCVRSPMSGNDYCIRESQACVLVCWNAAKTKKVVEKDAGALRIKEMLGIGAAVENMLLAAFALGLGAVWLCSPLYAQKELQKILRLPADASPVAFVCVGYPAGRPRAVGREPLGLVTLFKN